MMVIFSALDDLGENQQIEKSRDPDWYSCWSRMAEGDVYYQRMDSPDPDILASADIAVIILFDVSRMGDAGIWRLGKVLGQLQCPVIFEWENILHQPTSTVRPDMLHAMVNMLDPFSDKVMYDFYIDPDTVGLRGNYMVGCEPLTSRASYFDTHRHRELFDPNVEKDGSIFVVYDALDYARNGYWSHKYANDIAMRQGVKYYTHKGYGHTDFNYHFFDRRSILDHSGGLPYPEYIGYIERASLVVNLDDRPWQGCVALDCAAAQTPYLCINRAVLHKRLWSHAALDHWHNVGLVMSHGMGLYNNMSAAAAAYDKLDDIDCEIAKRELRQTLEIDF